MPCDRARIVRDREAPGKAARGETGRRALPTQNSPAVSPTPTPSPAPAGPQPSAGPAYGSALQAAQATLQTYLGLHPATGCQSYTGDIIQDSAKLGDHAAYFTGAVRCKVDASGGPGAAALVYVVQDDVGWRPLDVQITKQPGFVATLGDTLTLMLKGCANVREAPSTAAPVISCLRSGAHVTIDGGRRTPPGTSGGTWREPAGWCMSSPRVTGSGKLSLIALDC